MFIRRFECDIHFWLSRIYIVRQSNKGQNMKFIMSIIIAVVAFFAVGFSLDEFTRMRGDDITIWAIIAGVIALVISLYKIKTGKAGSTLASDALGAIKDVKETIESNIDSKQAEFFSIAEQEYEDGEIDKGLWSQALVKAKGDENLRKVEYMKLRAKQLKRSNKIA